MKAWEFYAHVLIRRVARPGSSVALLKSLLHHGLFVSGWRLRFKKVLET